MRWTALLPSTAHCRGPCRLPHCAIMARGLGSEGDRPAHHHQRLPHPGTRPFRRGLRRLRPVPDCERGGPRGASSPPPRGKRAIDAAHTTPTPFSRATAVIDTPALVPLPMVGDMRALVRDHDWTATPFGLRAAWSPSLRASVDLVLASPLGMI